MKVTIAIPCYNAERWLRECLQSALDQSGIEPEVILVDDGSTDASTAIAREFGTRIQLLEGGHRGATHARNLALAKATGEWVQFLDADDYLEPRKIATQLAEAKGEADILYSPVWIESWQQVESAAPPNDYVRERREPSTVSPSEDLYTQWIRWHIPQTGGALWRREALQRLGGWKEDQPCCQEHELYLRALMAGLHFVFAPTPGAAYREWSSQTLCKKDPLIVTRERTRLMDALLAWLGPRATSTHRREIGRACLEMSRTWARYDLPGAKTYHAERKSRGLIDLSGPAAPPLYRLVYRLFGFVAAERVARMAR